MHECLDLALDGLAHDGRGIGHLQDASRPGERGLTGFVAGGLPGQVVRCRMTARKSRFLEAELVELLRPADDEAPPICPHAGSRPGVLGCGGCPLQTMRYTRQLEWKTRLALDALSRIGGIDADTLDAAWEGILASPERAGYRNRMTFAFGPGVDGLVLGQRSRGGADVVGTPDCALLPPGAREILTCAQEAAAQSGLPAWRASARRGGRSAGGFWRFLTLRQGWLAGETAPRWWAVCLTSPGNPTERAAVRALGERLLALGGASRLGAFIHEERGRDDALPAGERRVLTLDAQGKENPEAAILRLPLPGRTFALDAASFFQVNTGAAELL